MAGVSYRMSLLLGVAALSAPVMLAQESSDAEARQQTVIVTGTPIRDSQQAAIEAKRLADNVVDIISADTIGRFPDQNLADSLGRLPGVAIERDQGQARYINFRGAPFRYTSIAFDGINVPGAENGRIARFDSIPSVITRAVEANKAVTPDMPGESVSGYVNIRTFDPFEKDGLGVSLEAGYGEQDLGGGPVNKYNGRISYSNDTFGVMVFGSNNRRIQNTDNREFTWSDDGSTVSDINFRSYFVEREDNAYGGRIEVRPEEGPFSRLFVSSLYSEFTDQEERNQYVFGISVDMDQPTGHVEGLSVNRLLEFGKYENSTNTTTLGADMDLGDWSVEGRINYTETSNSMFLPIPYSIGVGSYGMSGLSADYDLSNIKSPVIDLYHYGTSNPATINDASYYMTLAYLVDQKLENDAAKFKLDAERDLGIFGLDSTLKLGASYDVHDVSGYGTTANIGGFPSGLRIEDYLTGVSWYTGFNNSIGATYYNNEGLRAAWDKAVDGLSVPSAADQAIGINEKILSAYAMATTRFKGGNLVYGARLEATDYKSTGSGLFTDDLGDVSQQPLSYADDYAVLLPSVHLNLDLRDDLKARFSATTGLSRPTYTEMRASASVFPTDKAVTGGNPELDPETTWGGDASLEWYYAPASLLSAGVFYRHIKDVIYASTTTVDGGLYLDSAAGQDWRLTGFANGQDGHLAGLELNFIGSAADILPAPFDGFGVSANVTLLDSEFKTNEGTKFSLPGTSDTIYNASVYYEKFGLSARLNYQYRDDWLSTTENDSMAEFWAAEKRVDVSVRYELPYEFGGVSTTLFFNGNNLTDETDVRYVGTEATPNQVEGYGSYYLFGIHFDY